MLRNTTRSFVAQSICPFFVATAYVQASCTGETCSLSLRRTGGVLWGYITVPRHGRSDDIKRTLCLTEKTATAATAALEMGPEYVQVEPACDAYRWGVAVSVTKSSRRRVFFRFATFFANFSSSSLCAPIVGIVNVTFFNEVLQTLFRRRNDEWYYNS